jgi:hypothetical protein
MITAKYIDISGTAVSAVTVSGHRVARWYIVKPKIPIWVNVGGPWIGKYSYKSGGLYSKIILGVRHAGLAQNPGPRGLRILAYVVKD